MAEYEGIIESLEQATGPDRELDADIDVSLFGGETLWKQANYTMEMYPASRRASKNHVGGFAHEHVPLVTASLDAAIALVDRVLPGYVWSISDGDEHGPNAFVHRPDDKSPVGDMAATPVIALLIALFRALQAKEAGHG